MYTWKASKKNISLDKVSSSESIWLNSFGSIPNTPNSLHSHLYHVLFSSCRQKKSTSCLFPPINPFKPEHQWPNKSPKSRQSPFRWGRVSVKPSVISWSRPVVQPNKRCDYHWHASRLTFVQSWQVVVLWGLKLCFCVFFGVWGTAWWEDWCCFLG